MLSIGLHAFIDESGHRASTSKGASAHFVMGAVVVPTEHLWHAETALIQLRADLGRQPDQQVHWNQIRSHTQRLRIAQALRGIEWMTISTVVVCKHHLTGQLLSDDASYLYTLRFLLERLSWLARDRQKVLGYTISHVVRLQLTKLRQYERVLRHLPGCQIAWDWLDQQGGRLDQPKRIELLQLADAAASATAAAFEPDRFGNTETRYLRELSPRLYRRAGGSLTSYGLKMHPWSDTTRAAYPWVAAL